LYLFLIILIHLSLYSQFFPRVLSVTHQKAGEGIKALPGVHLFHTSGLV
jgi:hypothetical protein